MRITKHEIPQPLRVRVDLPRRVERAAREIQISLVVGIEAGKLGRPELCEERIFVAPLTEAAIQ
jgi:hypothetical protein